MGGPLLRLQKQTGVWVIPGLCTARPRYSQVSLLQQCVCVCVASPHCTEALLQQWVGGACGRHVDNFLVGQNEGLIPTREIRR